MEEIWKPIEESPNYHISNLGRIKNINTNKFLTPNIRKQLYTEVTLFINKKSKTFKLHRLLALAFIPNPENKPTVNHIDKNKNNNSLNNLEWATMAEQNSALNKDTNKYLNNQNCRKVDKCCLKTGKIIETFNSIIDASLWIINNGLTKINIINPNNLSIISSKICSVCNKNRKQVYNFLWNYSKQVEEKENEIWKEISLELTNGINNYYISNLGRFKTPNGHIKENYKHYTGYKRLRIGDKKYLIHRLVALTFLPNPKNKPFVNHIDGNKLNNNLSNLEWVTCLENNIHSIKSGLSKSTKKIIQYDINMNLIKEFDSINDASKELKIHKNTIISNLKGRVKPRKYGFQFKYA